MRPWDDRIMHATEVEQRHGIKLRPCPFCGSEYIGLYRSHIPHITCMNCRADGPGIEGKDELLSDLDARQHQAVRYWNDRVTAEARELKTWLR